MNPFRKFVVVGALSLALSPLVGPVWGQGEVVEKGTGKGGRAVTVTVQFAPVGKQSYSATVPRASEGYVAVPIPVSEAGRWIVSVSRTERTFHIEATDPAIWSVGTKDSAPGPVTVFVGDFEAVYGKPITVLRTSAYTLEVTVTEE